MSKIIALLIFLLCLFYDLSSGFLYAFFIISFLFFRRKESFDILLNSFNVVVFFSLLLTVYSNLSGTDLSFSYLASDQQDFIEKAIDVNSYSFEIFIENTLVFASNGAMAFSYFFFGLISIFTNFFTQSLVVLNFQILIAFFTSLVCLEYSKIIYSQNLKNNRLTYYFLIGSPLLFYSTLILRDIFVLYFYLIAFRLFLSNANLLKKIFIILLCSFFSYSIRLESGVILLLLIPLIFVKNKKVLVISTITLLFLLVVILDIFFSNFKGSEELITIVTSNKDMRVEGAGLIKSLYGLQAPFNYIFVSLFYLIWPFPFFSLFTGILDIIPLFYFIFTSYYVFRNIYFLSFFKSYLTKINYKMFNLIIFSTVLIFINVLFEIQVRRILPSIAILFVFSSIISQNRINFGKKNKDMELILIYFFLFNLTYTLLKIL
jgi:hypothetical protein